MIPTGPSSDSTNKSDEESPWSAPDEAMHGILEALFQSEPPDQGRAGRHLAEFMTGGHLPAPVATSRMLAAGEDFGRFRVEEEVGRGGFGVVYRATDSRLGRVVALKVPRPDRVQSIALWDRFAREARLAGALDHDAIVPVLDAGFIDGTICIVSAYQEGETLGHWLSTRHPSGMPVRLVAQIAAQLAAGLQHAHEHGVLHRDLKPANVLVVRHEEGKDAPVARITDFGLGTIEDGPGSQTLTGFWQGSPPYMAPEQVLPNIGRVDARSDLYALGAILFELLTGQTIYSCDTILEMSVALGRNDPPIRPRSIRHDIPRDLETIVLACLERAPNRRYPSAAVLLNDLVRFLDGRPILARPVSIPERLLRWARRRPSQAGLVTVALLTTVGTAALLARHERQLSAKNSQLIRGNERLKRTVVERDVANSELASTLERLTSSEKRARRAALASDLQLADRELRAGRVEMVQMSLRRHEPAPNEEDLRDFAWHFLMRQATRPYAIQPLRGLSWWQGPEPLSPVLLQLDRTRREAVEHELADVLIDRDGIRARWGERSFVLASRYFGFSQNDPPSDAAARLWFDDGRQLIPTSAMCHNHALGPGGKVLVLVNGAWETEANEAPALVRHRSPTLTMGASQEQADENWPGTGTPSTPHVVEIPNAVQVTFSGDGRMVGCLAWCKLGQNDYVRPLFYELSSDWRATNKAFLPFEIRIPGGGRRVRTQLALSHNGELAAVTGKKPIVVFETRTGRKIWSLDEATFGKSAIPTCVSFSPDGSVLVTGDSKGDVKVWDVATRKLVNQFPVNLGFVNNVGFHPDSKTVAIFLGREDAIRFWSYSTKPELPELLDHGDEIWGLAFAEGGKTLLSAGDDDRIKAWDLASGKRARSLRCDGFPNALAVNGAGTHVAIGLYAGGVSRQRTTLTGSDRVVFKGMDRIRVRAVAFSPDNRTLAAGGHDPRVLIATGVGEAATERRIVTPFTSVFGLAFSPDGKILAVGSHDHAITLWDSGTLRHFATLRARERVACLAYAPDGSTLVSGDTKGALQFWDMPSGTLRATVTRASETGGVWSVCFSPDSKTLASGGDDGMVRLWDPELGIERLTLSNHRARVHAVTFAPDGKTLATGDFSGKIHLWRAGP